ncbi:hypothetical protein BG004_000308, partial [Podila humilis]
MNMKEGPISLPLDNEVPVLAQDRKKVNRRWSTSKKLLAIFGSLLAVAATWLYWSGIAQNMIRRHSQVDLTNAQCRQDRVNYEAATTIEASNLEIKFSKGAITADLYIVLDDDITKPHLEISGHTSVPIEGKSELHFEVDDDDDKAVVNVWADRDLDSDGNRLCANLRADLRLPKNLDKFGSLKISGNVLQVKGAELGSLPFDKVEINALEGLVSFEELNTAELVTTVTNGPIDFEYLTSPYNTPLKTKLKTKYGEIRLVAVTPAFEDDDSQKNDIRVLSTTGDIYLGVNAWYDFQSSDLRLHPSSTNRKTRDEIRVNVKTTEGKIVNKVYLNDDHTLFLTAKSTNGRVLSQV